MDITEFIPENSNFRYAIPTLEKKMKENKVHKVCMYGTAEELKHLKAVIEELYNEQIFYLSYWKGEAQYHGWDWSKDDGTLKNQAKVTDGITEKFLDIYALILSGLYESEEE